VSSNLLDRWAADSDRVAHWAARLHELG
jgi:hypothetical protein